MTCVFRGMSARSIAVFILVFVIQIFAVFPAVTITGYAGIVNPSALPMQKDATHSA